MSRDWPPVLWTGLWVLVVATAIWTRPPLPVDETRYLAVAWDMWLEGHYLVPHLNGEAYSHKPPLLFWLICLGWGAFGVNAWWPSLVAPAFGLGCLFLTASLARALWPDDAAVARTAPLALFGGLFWALFTTLTMFDMLLAFFALVALIGTVRAWRRGGWAGFALLGLGLGLGVLAKGPAILVHTLPAALLAPAWGPRLAGAPPGPGPGRWYLGVLGGLALGAGVGLAWAVPAGIAGGEAYRDAIFWGQSAGRMVESFAHGQPWWWYGAALPVLLLPWLAWPPAWRAAGRARAAWADGGVRFAAAWAVPALVIFSVISGKQFHYLLPELPAIALVLARLLGAAPEGDDARPWDQLVPGLLTVLAGAAVVALPHLPVSGPAAASAAFLDEGWGLVLVTAGVGVAVSGGLPPAGRLGVLAGLAAVFVVVAHLVLGPVVAAAYDLRPLALRLGQWERQGRALANFGKYHGQYHFLGRLTKPMAEIGLVAGDRAAFLEAHPDGLVVAYHETVPTEAEPLFTQPFRTRRTVAVWEARALVRHPGIAEQ